MAALKMHSRISSPRSILTAAFYTSRSAHPRCWARATENRLPLSPSSCSFLKRGRLMHFSLLPPHSNTSLCPRNPHPVCWTGVSERSSAVLSRFIGWQCLLIRHRNDRGFQTSPSPFQRGHSYNAAAQCREMLSPFTVKGSELGWVKASVYHPQRLPWAAQASLGCDRDQVHSACWELWEHSRTGHLGIMYYLESTLTKITDWTGALWYVCPTSIAKELYLLSFPDLYQSLRSDFLYLK